MDIISTEIASVIEREMARWTVPGIVVGVLRDGQMTTRAWGVANLRSGEPMREDALFRVASISKVFTATLVMALADDGVLDIDTPVSHYLPDLRLTTAGTQDRVTLRHLLSHGSGQYGDYFVDHGIGEDAAERAIAEFGTLRLMVEPDELWFYCNSGFHLAGRIVEVVIGKPFDQVMRERIFEPLGLERTCFFAHDAIAWPHAVGHDQVAPGSDEHVVAGQYYPRNRFPAGGVMSNAPELLRFAAFHMHSGDGEGIIRTESLRAMRETQREAGNWCDAWGIGWDIRWIDGVPVIAHGGSINGCKTQLTLVPETQTAFAILTNSGRGTAAIKPIERALLAEVSRLREAERPRVSLDPDILAQLAGQYEQAGVVVDVTVDGGQLRLESHGPWGTQASVPYPTRTGIPIGDREFLIPDGEDAGERFDFILHPDGRPRFLRLHGRLHDARSSS